jgi:hypothetical protein
VGAGIDEPFYIADGAETDLDRVVDRERNLPRYEPVIAIAAAQGLDLIPCPLQSQEDAAIFILYTVQPPSPDHHIPAVAAALEKDLVLSPEPPTEQEVIVPIDSETRSHRTWTATSAAAGRSTRGALVLSSQKDRSLAA